MSDTINVLIVFDADTILADNSKPSLDPNNPTFLSSPAPIYMMVDAAHAGTGQGSTELAVNAQTGDTIRWRESTLAPTDYEALLYQFTTGAGNLISPPTPIQIEATVPFPNPAAPTQPQTQTVQDYFWNCTVQQPGNVTYHFNFMLVDRGGTVNGYFSWDPFINISM